MTDCARQTLPSLTEGPLTGVSRHRSASFDKRDKRGNRGIPNPVQKLIIALILMLAGLPAAQAEPPKKFGIPSCRQIFASLRTHASTLGKKTAEIGRGALNRVSPPRSLTPEEFMTLYGRPLSDYFVEGAEQAGAKSGRGKPRESTAEKEESTLKVRGNGKLLMEGLQLNSKALARFHADFDMFMHNRKSIQGLSRYSEFKKWWLNNREVYMTKPVIETFIERGMTFGEFLDHLHLHYVATELAKRNESRAWRFARAVLRHPLLVGASVPLILASANLAKFIWQLMVLGPGVQMVNAYTEPVVSPLSNTARQRGSQDLGDAAEKLQEFLIGASELEQFKMELEEITAELEGLSPEEAKQRWNEFELMYFRIFQRFQQTLPNHLGTGRGWYKDFTIMYPMYFSSALADFDMQYLAHEEARAKLLARIEESGEPASREDARRLEYHSRQMKAAEKRIAATLAAWKINEFMHPELREAPSHVEHRATLQHHYETFRDAHQFDIYMDQFCDQMKEILGQLDFHYRLQRKLGDVAETIEAAESAPADQPQTAPTPASGGMR